MRFVALIAAVLLLGALSFLIGKQPSLLPPAVLLIWAVLVGAAATWFVHLVDDYEGEGRSEVVAMIVAGSALLFAWALSIATAPAGAINTPEAIALAGGAVLLAAGSAWVFDGMTGPSRVRLCFVCKQPAGTVAFTCPRCQQTICERPTCWIGKRFRCKYCDERDVILFPRDEAWWESRVGPRIRTGSCCYNTEEAPSADLRACGRCRWTQCRRCWDYLNGQCSHCDWWMPNLPKVLLAFVGREDAGGRESQPVRRSR